MADPSRFGYVIRRVVAFPKCGLCYPLVANPKVSSLLFLGYVNTGNTQWNFFSDTCPDSERYLCPHLSEKYLTKPQKLNCLLCVSIIANGKLLLLQGYNILYEVSSK